MTDLLRQCLLQRYDDDKEIWLEDVYWIDNKFAQVAKRVQDKAGIIWTVKEVYSTSKAEDVLSTAASGRDLRYVLDK